MIGPVEVKRVEKVVKTETTAGSENERNGSVSALGRLGVEGDDGEGVWVAESASDGVGTLRGDHRRLPPSTSRGEVAVSMSDVYLDRSDCILLQPLWVASASPM